MPFLSSLGEMIPHHTGESSGNVANHAVRPETVIKPPTAIQPPHLPTVVQPSTVILTHITINHASYSNSMDVPSLHPPAASYPYHLTNPSDPTLSPLNPSHPLTFSCHGSPHQTQDSSGCYKVCFKVGNISVCNGCQKSFTDYDIIVIQHAQFRHYTNPQTGLPASKFGNGNAYPRKACIVGSNSSCQ